MSGGRRGRTRGRPGSSSVDRGNRFGSIRVGAGWAGSEWEDVRLTARAGRGRRPGSAFDRILDEVARPVAEQDVDAAGVPAPRRLASGRVKCLWRPDRLRTVIILAHVGQVVEAVAVGRLLWFVTRIQSFHVNASVAAEMPSASHILRATNRGSFLFQEASYCGFSGWMISSRAMLRCGYLSPEYVLS